MIQGWGPKTRSFDDLRHDTPFLIVIVIVVMVIVI